MRDEFSEVSTFCLRFWSFLRQVYLNFSEDHQVVLHILKNASVEFCKVLKDFVHVKS